MTVAIVVESEALVGPDLRWPLRIASPAEGAVVINIVGGLDGSGIREIDLSPEPGAGSGDAELAGRVRGALDAYLGPERWSAKTDDTAPAGSSPPDGPGDPVPLLVSARVVPESAIVESTLARLKDPAPDTLVIVAPMKSIFGDGEFARLGREFERRCACRIVYVGPGERREDGDVMASVATGHHARAATRLAARLAAEHERRLIALYAEPDIGPEAKHVGRRILDRRLRSALDDGADGAEGVIKRVEVTSDPAKGIVRAGAEQDVEVVLRGVSRIGARGGRGGDVPLRAARGAKDLTVIGVSSPVPLRGQVLRRLESGLQTYVPQLAREDRTSLVERIQSSSQWNLDFVLLMGMATMIASLGLIDDSVAVIIGAMLIAPLMTPLLGLGLAIAQGNPRLARMTLKASGLGFLTAFGMGLIVGLLSGEFHVSTTEMAARDWPQLLDLVVAFVGGLAAAYASGRPGLLAAPLPGVAIAAALVPPIATAGLGVSIGNYNLALGAAMLFLANTVAIILASALSFWAVGVRIRDTQTIGTRLITALVVLGAVGMAIGFTLAPPRLQPPWDLVRAVEATLGEETRLRQVNLRKEEGEWVVHIDLGGAHPPDEALGAALLQHAKTHLGAEAGIRMTHRYEVLAR